MKIYMVGGAVRDRLLQRPVHDTDWVVVGASPEDMTARGFTSVGRDFPVFLHPETHGREAARRHVLGGGTHDHPIGVVHRLPILGEFCFTSKSAR